MTYEDIRKIILEYCDTHTLTKMNTSTYGSFSVMSSNKVTGIILDTDILPIVAIKKWCIDSGGYPVANYNSNLIRLYDCVMALSYADKPINCYVDHINQDKLDNRRLNLRFVTPLESSMNMPLKSNNTSGVTGVTKTKYNMYRAYITINGKRIELGYYNTLEEAKMARLEAETRLGFLSRPGTLKELCEREVNNGHK